MDMTCSIPKTVVSGLELPGVDFVHDEGTQKVRVSRRRRATEASASCKSEDGRAFYDALYLL